MYMCVCRFTEFVAKAIGLGEPLLMQNFKAYKSEAPYDTNITLIIVTFLILYKLY
jgi:hypothetical protein